MKKNQSGFVGIAIAVLIALILGGGGAYVYNKTKEAKKDVVTEESVTVDAVNTSSEVNTTVSPLVNSSTSVSSDWKTYKNEKYGFEFKYRERLEQFKDITDQITTLDCNSSMRNKISLRLVASLGIQLVCESAIYGNPDRVNKEVITVGGRTSYYFSYTSSTGYQNQDAFIPYQDGFYINISHSYKKDMSNYILISEKDFKAILSTFKFTQTNSETSNLKRYDSGRGFEFMYPSKLTVMTESDGTVVLSHKIPFENVAGGCDLKGDGIKSQTLGDFNVSFKITSEQVKLPYIDGTYSKGTLQGSRAYMGAEGCGNTVYHFPLSQGRTLIVTKSEIQILSDNVAPEIKRQVLAVPGVISNEEAKVILDGILGSFKVY